MYRYSKLGKGGIYSHQYSLILIEDYIVIQQ